SRRMFVARSSDSPASLPWCITSRREPRNLGPAAPACQGRWYLPTLVLLAPCDAEVTSVHPSGHAVTLRAAAGVELILHIGLDTVTLKGQGFTPRTRNGASVRAGDPLIEFDA